MAKNFWTGDTSFETNWGGDATTNNQPLSGERVQEIIKNEVNSKAGYLKLYEKGGYYVLAANEAAYEAWEPTVVEGLPFGDESLIVGHFDAPYNYSMKINFLDPTSGYKSSLVGTMGNFIRFYAATVDKDDSPVPEDITVTFKITNENGVSTQQNQIFKYSEISNNATGVVYELDNKLSAGRNTITVTAVGMNTGASTMKSITYNYVDINFTDTFDIAKAYQFSNNNIVTINVGYSLKGVGRTSIYWFIDGQQQDETVCENDNPNLMGQNKAFYFNKNTDAWLNPGVHNLQMYMVCEDINSREKFYTPIYYREFIIEETNLVTNTPFILKKAEFAYDKGILPNGNVLTIEGGKQYENITITYAICYNGKAKCDVETYTHYNEDGKGRNLLTSEEIPLENNFSKVINKTIPLEQTGSTVIYLKALNFNGDGFYETSVKLGIEPNDMKIRTVNDSVVLYLNASGRTNETADRASWVYKYTEAGEEKEITTTFSKNEYVKISTIDDKGNVIKPDDATEENSEVVSYLPIVRREDKKYLIYNNEYYVWTREFEWSETSGWYDNKLRIGKDNMITINFQPFSANMVEIIKRQGATFEFEFETTNVYDDNAVICRICGNKNFAPGISIYASGAEMVISREIVKTSEEEGADNTNAGYIKAVSTKYKSEESNRISFVITPDIEGNREKLLLIYVNGECCGAYPYPQNENFFNNSTISFRGTDKACVNISNIKLYSRRLTSNDILDNYIYYRLNTNEKIEIYRRNDIVLANNTEAFDSTKLLSQLPVMTFYQINENEPIDRIHQEKKDKKLPLMFDVTYIDVQNPEKNFLVKNAYVTPQGTSSMNYPIKNLRLYTGKKNKAGEYYSRLFVGSNIFKNGDATDLRDENINFESEVSDKKRRYAFKDGAIPVNCWCLKADFAESSSSHNTGTSRFWNGVLKASGLSTKAQIKAAQYEWGEKGSDGNFYQYDVRTAIDGFPIAVFYQGMNKEQLRFEGKYNFNNDKSTEDVFGFTGGIEISGQEYKYYYIGTSTPQRFWDSDKKEWSCEFGDYTETPNEDSPLYASGTTVDDITPWYMLRGKNVLDNPKMECWELLNSVNEIALFKTAEGFGIDPEEGEKVGIVNGKSFDEAFESRYPDCGDYYHTNSLKRFVEWLVSCRYLDIDNETGKAIPVSNIAKFSENYYRDPKTGKISIISLTKQPSGFTFDFPDYNFYTEVKYENIQSSIKGEGYQYYELPSGVTSNDLIYADLGENEIPPTMYEENGVKYHFVKNKGDFYVWKASNLGVKDELPTTQQTEFDFIKVGDKYYQWINYFNFSDYYETQWVEDNAFNRALKFAVEKYDHIEMNKMAAYYIYLMRFGGVDQTVKNSMLTTEGPASDDPNSTLPSLWYFINYDNDTILGVKNDGRLVFDPYITRETKDGNGYVYAGRESTLWNNLEGDIEFMNKVTEIDNQLAAGTGDTRYALSYGNALREYDINQSDKWCERIYNKDAERKYLDTYVKGWKQHNSETNITINNVYEDFLYDVQGSRSAHRKWWLGRRFNIYDSKFCNSNFRSSFIKFRSTNLPAGSSFSFKSGEPIYYAWGHDNSVTEMTDTAIQPGEIHTFTTNSTFNIGSYLELMGAANMMMLDLRGCVGDLTEINVENCYSSTIGTKLQELFIGDHTKTNLFNVSTTQMNFGGLGNLARLEVLDITNIQNIFQLDGLEKLVNIREVYAKGSNVSNFTFANGSQIEMIELPRSLRSLSLTKTSNLKYSGLRFEDSHYGELTTLSIVDCPNLMKDPTFVFNWIATKNDTQKENLNLNLQGIDWTFSGNEYYKLFELEKVGTSEMGSRSIGGNITITKNLIDEEVKILKRIFGDNCFSEGAALYISAPTDIFIDVPEHIWEGTDNLKCNVNLVGTKLDGSISLIGEVKEIIGGEEKNVLVEKTDGIINIDTTYINNGYVLISIDESAREFKYLYLNMTYTSKDGQSLTNNKTIIIQKRIYPETVSLVTAKDSFNNVNIQNEIRIDYTPDEIDNINYEGRGFFTVEWELVKGTIGFDEKLVLFPETGEVTTIKAPQGHDGKVTVGAYIRRNWDGTIVGYGEKELEFTNPNTILTKDSNEPIYNILLNAGIIKEEGGFGKLTKNEASQIEMKQLVDSNGVSIFKGHTEIQSFLEFRYFNSNFVGQMDSPGNIMQLTPIGMFEGCTNLKEIAFSRNFKFANDKMFSGCTNLEHIYGESKNENDADNGQYNDVLFEYVGTDFANGCKKLKTCFIGNTLKTLKNNAFKNCESLSRFNVSSDSNFVVEYNTSSTPFVGCKNIVFDGVAYDGSSTYAKYQVLDGCMYGVDGDTLTLIHMGKDSKSSNIPTDKTVIACAYSMEYRTENDVIIPENVKFNGRSFFYGSVGNSVKLNNKLTGTHCNYLFEMANYKGNYYFAEGETLIPAFCFRDCDFSDFTSFTVPVAITTIENDAFYNAKQLKNLYFEGPTPPSIDKDEFWGLLLDNIYVLPQYIDVYRENIMPLLKGFVTPRYLHNEGYVRIVKDGYFLFSDDENIVTVGGLSVELTENDYMKYSTPLEITDTNVYLNGEVIGRICTDNTTIYLGDNSLLFDGSGYDFTKGIYDETMKQKFDAEGWFYDSRFEGVRSKKDLSFSTDENRTSIEFNMPDYANAPIDIEFGKYCLWLSTNYFEIPEAGVKVYGNGSNDFNQKTTITVPDGKFTTTFVHAGYVVMGIDGIVLNKIGDSIYSDPEFISTFGRNRNGMDVREITVSLVADTEIPESVFVTVTDNKSHEYRKRWRGENLTFVVPNGFDLVVSANDFTNGKKYQIKNNIVLGDKELVELEYTSKSGIEVNGNILSVFDEYNDWYVCLDKFEGAWGDVNVESTDVEDIEMSDADGYKNTFALSKVDDNIFRKAIETTIFGEDIIGYIPSHIEVMMFENNLSVVNDYLRTQNKKTIDFNGCWTSESYDSQHAWTCNGEKVLKTNTMGYYVFGKNKR